MGRVLRRALLGFLLTSGVILGAIVADGVLSGWTGLAGTFRAEGKPGGLQLVVQEGGVGNARWYHRVAPLRASVGLGGLWLSYPAPYNLGHPPLEIPWSQLRILSLGYDEGESTIVLSVSLPERARITLRGELAEVVGEWLQPRR